MISSVCLMGASFDLPSLFWYPSLSLSPHIPLSFLFSALMKITSSLPLLCPPYFLNTLLMSNLVSVQIQTHVQSQSLLPN